ncbi:hypothetical protein AHAS_Ahas07G0093900 [Arachis hypogaea]
MDPNNNNNVVNPHVLNAPKVSMQLRRTLGSDTTPSPNFYGNSIVVPLVAANNFELKYQLISLKLTKLRTDVQTFKQREGKSLYEAWERYKLMLKKCPPDIFSDWIQLYIFYDGVTETAKMSLDNYAGESLRMKKIPKEAIDLIEMVANNQYLYSFERASVKKGVMELDALNVILAQNKTMSQQISAITQHLRRMQVSAINTQDTSYNMSGASPQGESYDYAQFFPE